MKGKFWIGYLILGLVAWVYAAQEKRTVSQSPVQQKQTRIDLAFCLDTTGSMTDLIEGAKQKIWSIVNAVATGKPKPTLRIALVAYRDQGDDYVTRVFGFTSDLEAMYTQLRALRADGGGDTPEHVNRALHEAIHELPWSTDPGALKILYLVGDAPPHMNYQDGYEYRKVCQRAAGRGIIINTIQCGRIEGTREVWQEIARLAEGKYAGIDQSGGMIAVSSPYDRELARLSSELNKTYVAYGADGRESSEAQRRNDEDVVARSPAAAAERAASKAGSLYHNESWDLIDALRSKTVELEKLKSEELPAELRGKSVSEQRAYLDRQAKERVRIQEQIQELGQQRDAFVTSEMKKLQSKNSFDAQVLETLREQAKEKGIEFNK